MTCFVCSIGCGETFIACDSLGIGQVSNIAAATESLHCRNTVILCVCATAVPAAAAASTHSMIGMTTRGGHTIAEAAIVKSSIAIAVVLGSAR